MRPKPLRVGIVLADHFTLSSFALFVDVLRLAADKGDLSKPHNVRWAVMSARPEPILSSCGARMCRTSELIDPRELDYVVVVGGLLHFGSQIDERTEHYLREAARIGTPLVGICTGSFILCRAGLMKDRLSCVSWYHRQDFLDEFPGQRVVADQLFVIDGDRITCAGGAAASDLASHLVTLRLHRTLGEKACQLLQFAGARAGDEAQPHPPIDMQVSDVRVRRTLLLMEQHLTKPLRMQVLADELQVTTRQLERLFRAAFGCGPAEIYRRVRMRYAAWLLRHTSRPVTEIALNAGYSDGAHFSREFRREHGWPPSEARRKVQRRNRASELAASRVFD